MRQKILFSIFGALAVFIAGVLTLLAMYANSVKLQTEKSQEVTTDTTTLFDEGADWVKRLADIKSTEYFTPVTELFIAIDLKKEPAASAPRLRSYRLEIPRISRYSLFCILHHFKNRGVGYLIVKEKGDSKIVVEGKDKESLGKLLKELEQYDIYSTITEV